MEIQFQFKYQETDIRYNIKTDELDSDSINEILAAVGKASQVLISLLPDDYEYNGNVCHVCDRIFKGPAALKQHQTVMGHNSVASID